MNTVSNDTMDRLLISPNWLISTMGLEVGAQAFKRAKKVTKVSTTKTVLSVASI